jgi:Predicted membrane protein/domain
MYCPKCGKKSTEEDNFCISCGEDLKLHKNRTDSHNINAKPNLSYESENYGEIRHSYSRKPVENSEIQLASLGSRIGAYIIDMLLIIVLFILIVGIIASIQAMYLTDDSYGLFIDLLYIFIFFGYFILLEGPLGKGRTVGKRALKLRVIKKDQSMIGYGASFGRNILRLIDGLFFYIIGMILISGSDLNQRLGDRAADTIVIKENNDENKLRQPTSLGYS